MNAFPLVPVHASILSSYDAKGQTGGPRTSLKPLATLGKAGIATADTATALLALHIAVLAAGGDFRITECHRDVAVQVVARAKYDRWVAAGKPKPGTTTFDAKNMKADYVAIPGKSGHNAGRSIDVHIGALNFPNVAADKQLDKLWEICRPLGWTPVIKEAKEGASESWHFDFWGELSGVYARLGYGQAAFCGALLVGHAGKFQTYPHLIQALICRAGFNIGEIDGFLGPRTRAVGAVALNMTEVDFATRLLGQDVTLVDRLASLPAA